MSSDLGDDARALLRMTRHEGLPDAASIARVRAELLGKVGAAAAGAVGAKVAATAASKAAAAAGAATPTTTAAATAALVAPSILKGAAAVLVAASIGATAYLTRDGWMPDAHEPKLSVPRSAIASASSPPAAVVRAPSTPPAPAPPPATAPPPTPKAPPATAPLPTSTAAPQPARTVSPALDPLDRPRPPVRPLPATPSPPTAKAPIAGSDPARSAPPSGVASLAPDLARLREAHRALGEGKPERAIDAASAIPDSSPLREQRDGVRTIARCTLARRTTDESAARAARERFLSSYPGSSLAARVDESCMIRPR